MTTERTTHDPATADAESAPSTNSTNSVNLPALIEKAKGDLATFLKEGAHVLCPINVTDPVPGHFPRVVAIKINPDPAAREVYVKEWEYPPGKPRQPKLVELTKIGLQRLSDMMGISWDSQLSGRIDDGSVSHRCVFRKVGRYRDYYGEEHLLDKSKNIDIESIRDVLILEYEDKSNAYQKKLTTKYKDDVPKDWFSAYEENRITEWIHDKVRRELAKKRQYIMELAETGAMLGAIRSKGIRTTYTPAELEKHFVDIRTIPLPGAHTRQQAEQAHHDLYGSSVQATAAHPGKAKPAYDETIVDVESSPCQDEQGSNPEHDPGLFDGMEAKAWQPAKAHAPASSTQSPSPAAKPSASLESNLLDFEASEPDQQMLMILSEAAQRQSPIPVTADAITGWSAVRLKGVYKMLLESPLKGGRP